MSRAMLITILLALVSPPALAARARRITQCKVTRSGWFAIVALALAAMLIRLVIPVLREGLDWALELEDSSEYIQLAQGLRHGCGFARLLDGGCAAPELLRTPGYPLFLAMMPTLRWALVAQALLQAFTCIMVAVCVRRRSGLAAALLAEMLVAVDMPSFVHSSKIMSDVLFQALVLVGVGGPLMLFARGRFDPRSVWATLVIGSALGLAILVRPIGEFIPILVPIPFLMMSHVSYRRRLALALVVVSIPLITIVGWSERNARLANYRGLSTVGALNLYFHRAGGVIAYRSGVDLHFVHTKLGREVGIPFEDADHVQWQSSGTVSELNRRAVRILMRYPATTLSMTVQSALYLALAPIRTQLGILLATRGVSTSDYGLAGGRPDVARMRRIIATLSESPMLTILAMFQFAVTLFTWLGIARALWLARRGPHDQAVWILYPLACAMLLLLLAAGAEADVRFRLPAVPLLAIVAALGWSGSRRSSERPSAE